MHELHVWTAQPRHIAGDDWTDLEALLDGEEIARAHRFRFRDDRCAYVLAHALRRAALARALATHPSRIRFAHDSNGQPGLLTPGSGHIHFSHSRSRDVVALAVTDAAPVGIDVEPRATRVTEDNLLARFVSTPHPSFFPSWAALEAFWKARGTGLHESNPRLRIRYEPDGTSRIAFESDPDGVTRGRAIDLAARPDCATSVAWLCNETPVLFHHRISSAMEIKQLVNAAMTPTKAQRGLPSLRHSMCA
jgi:hypothetical protein